MFQSHHVLYARMQPILYETLECVSLIKVDMLDKVVSRVLHFEPQSDVMPQHITVITQGFNEKNFIIFDCFV